MTIRNGRPVQDQFTLDRNGFAITGHTSAVTDFTDREEVDQVYVGEVAEFVQSYTGADRVATPGWALRRSAAPAESARSRRPPWSTTTSRFYARERAKSAYASHFPDGPGFRRALITSLCVHSPPPQDRPLALCDYTSVSGLRRAGQPPVLRRQDPRRPVRGDAPGRPGSQRLRIPPQPRPPVGGTSRT